MLSLNIADLFGKVLSFPNRDKDTSLVKFSNAQNLMNDKFDMYQHMSYLCNQELIENGWISPEYSMFNAADLHTKLNSGIHRMVGNSSKINAPKLTFPHYAKVIPDLIRFPFDYTDMLFNSSNYLNYIPDILCDKTFMNPVIMADLISDPNFNFKLFTDSNTQNLKKDMTNPVVNLNPEVTHSHVNISKSEMTRNETQELSGSHKLSQELANRKAKELHKRSKKRRRRQKKQHRISLKFESCETSEKVNLSSDAAVDKVDSMPMSSNSRYLSDCKYCKSSDVCGKLSCSNKCENQKSDFIFDIISVQDNTASTVQIVLPNVPSFLISVESLADDDSDWDSSTETDWLPLTSEFELPGLFVASLTSSKIDSHLQDSPVPECEVAFSSKEELEELKKLQIVLNEVNKNWEEATKEIDKKPRLPAKVSFAPDNELVEVMPVEIYDRKGEWERYAIERTHFRRRIDELEKVLSPCLSADHRSRVLELRQSRL